MIRVLEGLSAMPNENGKEVIDRADWVLVRLGHFDSRSSAQAAHQWVLRSGVKLAHALDVFEFDVSGLHGLDIGASIGGFTQVLLARGARSAVAVDVGRDQLHEQVASNVCVVSLESKDAKALTAVDLGAPPDLVVCDASFISLRKLLAVPLSLASQTACLVTLFKPQFEVGREHVGKGGIVRDSAAVQSAEAAFVDWLHAQGWHVEARTDSPIKGGDGNAERLVYAVRV